MSQSRAILTLHRRTGGDTQGGRALSRRTVRARGAPRLPCREQRVTARTSRPGPASKLPSFGRRGLGENPANAVGRRRRLFVFKKSGSACRRLGSSEATRGGGRRRKEGRLLGPEAERELGKWCCSGYGRGLQAARPARGPRGNRAGGGCSSAPAGPPAANFCGLRGGGSRCVGRPSPPPRGPHPAPAAACAAQPRRVCAATQLARATRARPPAGKPSRASPAPVPASGDRGCCSCARARNVVTAGTRWRHGPGRRDDRLASCENLEPASLLVPACGALCRRGDFAGTDLRRSGGCVGAGNWGQYWRGLGWSSERAGRTTSVEPPHPARPALLVHLRPVIWLARPRTPASLAGCWVPWCLS